MKKNIIIIILVVTNLISIVFAFAQNTLVKKTFEIAEINAQRAMTYADSASMATEQAKQQRLIAEKIMEDLLNAEAKLADCK
jgi:shikimate kinase